MLADSGVFGADLLVWLVLALGGAMVVGNGLALVRPPASGSGNQPTARRMATSRPRRAKGSPGKSSQKAGSSRRAKGTPTGTLPAAPLGRSIAMITIGALAVVWSLATLITR